MSGESTSPIFQVRYWLGDITNNTNSDDADGGTYLSYEVFLILSVIGGFFGLDHLYLRSPVTFIAKFIVNLLCFGVWWIYDAAQAVFHSDVVKIYGLGIPGWGPAGIGAGVLTREIPDKKHMRFFIYAAGLFFGGLFGIDSFLVGDRQTGIIRLLCLISVIFAPIAFAWWGYKLFQFFTNTESITDNYYKFFGAPYKSLADRAFARFPLIGFLFSPMDTLQRVINNILGPALITPLTEVVKAGTSTVDNVVSTVSKVTDTAQMAIKEGSQIVDKVGELIDSASQATTITPAASLYSLASKIPPSSQSGGGTKESLNPLGYTLLGTFSLIALLGFVTTIYRANHVTTEPFRDDTPPEPRVLRKSDSKKPTTAA